MSAWSRRALQEAEPLLGSHHQLVRWDGVVMDKRFFSFCLILHGG